MTDLRPTGDATEGRRPDDIADPRRPDERTEGHRPDERTEGHRPNDAPEGRRLGETTGSRRPGDTTEGPRPDDPTEGRRLGGRDHGEALGILARAPAAAVTPLAERLLDLMPAPEVVQSRTGLVMLPMTDTVQGTDFHLGEVLVAEAHLRIGDAEGYAMVTGRDLERAMAVAVIDLAGALGLAPDEIAALVAREAARQSDADDHTLRRVAATRVEMETF